MVQSAKDSDTHRALVDAMHRAVQGDELDPSNCDQDKTNPPSVTAGQDEDKVDPWGEGDNENERDWSNQPSRDEFEFGEGEEVDLRDPSLLDQALEQQACTRRRSKPLGLYEHSWKYERRCQVV
ncbi:hypothetical protein FRC09_003113 [Ceratobasidium sp. 395]|nr:hypothetical protein FRC09_003113 [Ceratobasidium sp. 395]